MRKVLALLFLLAATAFAQAQTPAKVVVWTGDKDCGKGNELISCESLQTPRGNVSVINDTSTAVSIAASFFEDGDHIIAAIHLKNTSNESLMFDSDHWGAAHFKRDEARRGGRPIVAETSIPSRDLLRGIRSGVAIDNSADTFMASISKTGEVREVRRPDGTRDRTLVIVDDKQAVQDAGLRNDSRREVSVREQERIRKNALTQKSVPAMGSVKGLVYFRRVKKADIVYFSFRVLDSVYIFRLLRKPAPPVQ